LDEAVDELDEVNDVGLRIVGSAVHNMPVHVTKVGSLADPIDSDEDCGCNNVREEKKNVKNHGAVAAVFHKVKLALARSNGNHGLIADCTAAPSRLRGEEVACASKAHTNHIVDIIIHVNEGNEHSHQQSNTSDEGGHESRIMYTSGLRSKPENIAVRIVMMQLGAGATVTCKDVLDSRGSICRNVVEGSSMPFMCAVCKTR
jgi:hypothetical protein